MPWTKTAEIRGEQGNQSGTSVSFSPDGNTLAIGSPNPNLQYPGLVRFYTKQGKNWIKTSELKGYRYSKFGS